MYMTWSTKNKPYRDCSLWYRGCYAIGWAIEGCPGKGILDNPHIYIHIIADIIPIPNAKCGAFLGAIWMGLPLPGLLQIRDFMTIFVGRMSNNMIMDRLGSQLGGIYPKKPNNCTCLMGKVVIKKLCVLGISNDFHIRWTHIILSVIS